MSDHLTQWCCPYCSRVFLSRDDIKKHLETDKVCCKLLLPQPNLLLDSNSLSIFSSNFNKHCPLSPNCQQLRETTESSSASEEGIYIDLESTKQSSFRCPLSDCGTKQTFGKEGDLVRHNKTRTFLDRQAMRVL